MNSAELPPNPDPVLNQPITPELIKKHGLLPEEYDQIRRHLGRAPTLTELGIFSVMWSEHCSYKNTRPAAQGLPDREERRDREFRPRPREGGRGERGHHRRRRRMGDRVQDRVAQPPERHRALRGGGDGRRWDHPRHFHDGGAARCSSPTRCDSANSIRPSPSGSSAASWRASRTTATASGVPTVAGRRLFRPLATRATRW